MFEEVAQAHEDGAKLASSPLWSLSDTEVTDSLRAAHRWEQTAALLQLRLIQEAVTRGIPAARGHRTTAGWLHTHLVIDRARARDLSAHAAALSRRPTLEQAVLDGTLDIHQATAIAAAVNAVPQTLADIAPPAGAESPPVPDTRSSAEIADEAERCLIGFADQLPPAHLRKLGDRILAHVAPELADRADEAALRRQEARARRRRGFTLSRPHDGLVSLSGALSAEDAALVSAALQPLCTPTPGDERTPAQRRADALVDICQLALRTTELPKQGGEPAHLAVTVPYDLLTHELRAATLDDGERLSPEAARRMACDARILPAVLGTAGQVLDVGRTRRLATGPLRRAVHLRDGGCAFPGCDRPPRWCDAHHLRPWSAGGATALNNLVLLCRRHHTLLHDPASGWKARLAADHLPEFVPPPWVDIAQRPRRNPRLRT